jgi:hypothetical protein
MGPRRRSGDHRASAALAAADTETKDWTGFGLRGAARAAQGPKALHEKAIRPGNGRSRGRCRPRLFPALDDGAQSTKRPIDVAPHIRETIEQPARPVVMGASFDQPVGFHAA